MRNVKYEILGFSHVGHRFHSLTLKNEICYQQIDVSIWDKVRFDVYVAIDNRIERNSLALKQAIKKAVEIDGYGSA
jgi:hypothetical protein